MAFYLVLTFLLSPGRTAGQECTRARRNPAAEQRLPPAGCAAGYGTDGAFLEWIARQPLPAGRPVAVMINGGEEPQAYRGLFQRVEQRAVVGKHGG